MKLTLLSIIAVANGMRIGQDNSAPPADDPNAISREEVAIMDQFIATCPTEVDALIACYNNDQLALRACADCALEGFAALEGDAKCESKTEQDYEACSAQCNSECDGQVDSLYACGLGAICGGDLVVEIA